MGRKFTIFALFYFVFEGKFQVQAGKRRPANSKYKGRFNGGFFALRFWGAYIWRGLYMEGLIHGEAYFRNFTVVFYSLTVDVVFSCF